MEYVLGLAETVTIGQRGAEPQMWNQIASRDIPSIGEPHRCVRQRDGSPHLASCESYECAGLQGKASGVVVVRCATGADDLLGRLVSAIDVSREEQQIRTRRQQRCPLFGVQPSACLFELLDGLGVT